MIPIYTLKSLWYYRMWFPFTIYATWCIQRKETNDITSIMKKLCNLQDKWTHIKTYIQKIFLLARYKNWASWCRDDVSLYENMEWRSIFFHLFFISCVVIHDSLSDKKLIFFLKIMKNYWISLKFACHIAAFSGTECSLKGNWTMPEIRIQ